MKAYQLCLSVLTAISLMAGNAAAQTMHVNMRDGSTRSFPTGDIEKITFADTPQESEAPFEIEVSDITATTVNIKVTPEDPTVRYYFDVCVLSDYERYGVKSIVEGYYEEIVKQYPGVPLETLLAGSLSQGTDSDMISGLPSDTEFVCYAVGVNDEAKCVGDVSVVPFRTLQGGKPEDCTFDISYSGLSSTALTVHVRPSDYSIRYWMGIYPVADWPGDMAIPIDVKSAIVEYAGSVSRPVEDIVEGVSFRGELSMDESGLTPSTPYYIYVYAMDEHGDPAGKVFKQRFTTTDYDYSAAGVTLTYRYFDGTALKASYPEKFPTADGKAVVQVVMTPNEITEHYIWALAVGDLSDEDIYPEESTKQALVRAGYADTPTKTLIADWGDATFLYFGADGYGVDGKLFRTHVNIEASGARPVEEYEELNVTSTGEPVRMKACPKGDTEYGISRRLRSVSSGPTVFRKMLR